MRRINPAINVNNSESHFESTDLDRFWAIMEILLHGGYGYHEA